jgi:hypothetical protein
MKSVRLRNCEIFHYAQFLEETVDVKTENSVPEEQQTTGEDNEEEQQTTGEDNEEEQQTTGEDNEEEQQQQRTGEDNQEEPADEDSEDNEEEEEPKGPLTAVESTCILSDMVSKLTLIHEPASRPLPFVDESIAQKFLNCHKKAKDSTEISEADDIRTLEHCFQRYFKPEILSGENLFDCYYCRSLDQTQSKCFLFIFRKVRIHLFFFLLEKVLTEATRQTVFFQLPPILPLFLKRFQMVCEIKVFFLKNIFFSSF